MATPLKVLTNAGAQFAGKAVTVITSLIIVKIISSFGREFYGNYVTTYEFLAFFGILADGGLFAMAVREISKHPQRSSHILSNIFSMRLISIISVVLLAGIIGQLPASYPPEVKTGIWITSLSMALTIVAGTLSAILQARMKIQYFSGALAGGKIILAGLIFFMAQQAHLFENLFFTFLWAGVISNLFFCSIVYFFARREVPIRLGFDFSWWGKTLKQSLPYGLALILQTLYLRIDVILISVMLGASSVGTYGLATRILESFLILGVFFGQAILPKISAEESTPQKARQTLSWAAEILLLVSLPLIIGTVMYARPIIALISSPEFLSSSQFFGSDQVLILLVPTIFFAFFNQLFTFTLVAKNRQVYLMIVNALALAANALLNILLLPKYGIAAAAWTTIGCEVLVFLLLTKEIWQHFRLSFKQKNILFILFLNALLIAEFSLTGVKGNLILAVALGSFTYFGILWWQRKRFLPQ